MTLELLKTFCSTDKTRPGLCEPFNAGGKTYATDGMILIEVPLMVFNRETETRAPIVTPVLAFYPRQDVEWIPLPADIPPNPKSVKCDECKGRGGWKQNGHKSECMECDGTGKYTPIVGHDIGSLRLQVSYLNKLNTLPGQVDIAPTANKEREAMPFRFDGGRGLLMPIRKAVETLKRDV